MATSLKARLFTAASADAGLQALLLNGSIFQWFDSQLPQTANITTKSAVAVFLVSNPRDYVTSGRMVTSFSRVQFTIFGHGNDSSNADAVVAALLSFLDGFNASQASGTSPGYATPNYVVGNRDSGFVETDPMTYQRIVDVRIFSNDSF